MIQFFESPSLKLTASTRNVSEYKKLLVAEWDEDSLRATIGLIERFLQSSGLRLEFPAATTRPRRRLKSACPVDDALLGALIGHVFPVCEPFSLRQPKGGELRAEHWDPIALRCFTATLVQLIGRFEGDSHLLRDLQSLLLLQILLELLPTLRQRQRMVEHNGLIAALLYHVNYAWTDNDGHRLYLISEIAKSLARDDIEKQSLFQSYMLTDPEEHDFLTAVQQYWLFLLDKNCFDEAKEFLLRAFKRAPSDATEELREMFDLTYESGAAS